MMIDVRERTVPSVLRRGAERWPDKQAIVAGTVEYTYAQLHENAKRVAAGLADLGIGVGDRVALMLGNSIEHVLSWFGASCVNAAEVPLNITSMPTQMAYILNHSEARVLVIDEQYVERLHEVAPKLIHLSTVVVCGNAAAAEGLGFAVISFESLAAGDPIEPVIPRPGDALGILYTSGTTGAPKGVVVSQAQTYGRMWPGGPGTPRHDDRTLVVLPIYHVIGQCRALYNSLIAGATAVLVPRFSASGFWRTCRDNDITFVPLVGVMVSYLLRQEPRDDDRDHTVRHIALGTTSTELEEFRTRFGIEDISMSYGLTEAGGILVGDAEPSGCGFLRPDFEARLVGEDDIEVSVGDVGELVLRPREPWGAMTEYFKRPEETLSRWRNLWLHTGDLMWLRDDGMYMFAGRRAERIRVRGENVSPAEIEQHLSLIDGIADCAVVGIDADTGTAGVGEQEILAAVVRDDRVPIDFDAIVERLTHVLPPFASPRYFRWYDELPRTDATQRVQRTRIAQQNDADLWDARATVPHEHLETDNTTVSAQQGNKHMNGAR